MNNKKLKETIRRPSVFCYAFLAMILPASCADVETESRLTKTQTELSQSENHQGTARDATGSLAKNNVAVRSIDEGFTWLNGSKNTGRSYKIEVERRQISDADKPDLGAYEASTRVIPQKSIYDVVRWHRTGGQSFCDYQIDFASINDPARKTLNVVYAMCHDVFEAMRQNNYGVPICETQAEVFLGTRDINGFKNAFGVKLFCKRPPQYYGPKVIAVYEFWFHPDSNHFLRKIRQTSLQFINDSNQQINKDTKIPMPIATQYRDATVDVEAVNFINQAEPTAVDEFDKFPPSSAVSYRIEGAVKNPGILQGPAYCDSSQDRASQLQGLTLPYLYLMSADIKNPGSIKDAHGTWEPNFPVGSGSYAFGPWQNRNMFGAMLDGGLPQLTYTRIRDTQYFKVTLAGSIQLISKRGVASNGFYYTTAKDFTPGFYCFAINEKSSGVIWEPKILTFSRTTN